jgi:hypothetical protein
MKRSRQSVGKGINTVQSSEDVTSTSTSGGATNIVVDTKRLKVDESEMTVTLSPHDKAGPLLLSEDKLWCWGERGTGFCLARATHSIDSGKYFWECEILDPATNKRNKNNPADAQQFSSKGTLSDSIVQCSGESHVRLGWASDAAALNAPVGYDSFGFGYRDIAGSKVNKSVRTDHYGAEFNIGDVIGCHICIDRYDSSNSEMRFFKNGIDQGTAFKGPIIQGVFFPAVSLYRDACVRVNFGPFFIYPFNYAQKMAVNSDNQNEEHVTEAVDGRHFAGTLPVSELHPMSTEQKKTHGEYVRQRRAFYYAASSSTKSEPKETEARPEENVVLSSS